MLVERAVGLGGETGEEGFQLTAHGELRLGAVTGIGEVGGQQLELQVEIGGGGFAGENEGVFADLQAHADIASGEDAAEFVGGVPAEAASGKGGTTEEGEAGLVAGFGELTGADASAQRDGAGFEVGGLEVHAHAVRKDELGDAEVGDFGAGSDFSGGPEVGVGPGGVGAFGGRGHFGGGGGGVGLGDERRGGGGVVAEAAVADDGEAAGAGIAPGGAEGGEEVGGGEFGQGGGEQGEVGGGGGGDGAFDEGVDEFVGAFFGAAGGVGFKGLFEAVLVAGDGLAQFSGGEAELEGAAKLVFPDAEGLGPFARTGGELEFGSVVDAGEGVGAGGGFDEGCGFGFGEFGEATVQEIEGEVAGQIAQAFLRGVGAEVGREQVGEGDGRGAGLGLEVMAEAGPVGGGGAEVGLGTGGAAGGKGREEFAKLFFDYSGVEVADGDDGETFGAIPGVVEIGKVGPGGGFDDGFDADGQAGGQEGAGVEKFVTGYSGAVVGGVTGEFFGEDDAAFVVDLGGLEEQFARVVGQHAQALGEGGGFGVGQIEHVNGAVEGRVGVGIAAEVHAHALEKLDQGAGRVVGAAVKGQVLEKVGEPALGLGFVQGAGGDDQAQGNASAGFGVGAQGIGETVGQSAHRERGVGGEVREAGGGGEF